MVQALRSTTTVRRPVDMFFLPSGESSTAPAGSPREEAPKDAPAEVSRETPGGPKEQARTGGPTAKKRRSARMPPSQDQLLLNPEPVETPTPATEAAEGAPEDRTSRGKSQQLGAGASSGRNVSRETSPAENAPAASEGLNAVPGARFAELRVAEIHPNRKQPRQVFDEEELAELAFSVKELGVLQPVVVRPSRETDGTYELVMGERRWRAVQRAGLDTLPAIIRDTTDDDLLRDALLENLHRTQLNPLEEAAAYQQLMEEFGATQEELSGRIGRSRPQISNTLRLLRLPPLVQRRVAAGVLSSGHARALLGLTEPAEMERLAQRIVAEGLSVRATEEIVALQEGGKRRASARRTSGRRHEDRLNYIADAFSDKLDTSVKIQLGARKGKMTIEFASVEDLNRIIDVLDPRLEHNG